MKKKHDIYLFGHPITEYLPILFFFSIVWATVEIVGSIGEYNHRAILSVLYLWCSFLLYHYSNVQDKESKKNELAKLKQEARTLKDITETDKQIIKLLEKELEKVQDNSHQ